MKQTTNTTSWKTRALRRGTARGLNPMKTLRMTLAGRSDGRRGLPAKTPDSGWSSPRLQSMEDAYEAFSAVTWGRVQLELEEPHREAGNLVREIRRLETELSAHLREPPKAPEAGFFTMRRRGEEALSEKQIAQRRRRELEKRNAPYHARKRQLETEISGHYARLNALCSLITETGNAARLICERTAHRVHLLADAYWNGAMHTHPKADEMPASPEMTFRSGAEQTYLAQHAYLIETVTEMLRARAKLRGAEALSEEESK